MGQSIKLGFWLNSDGSGSVGILGGAGADHPPAQSGAHLELYAERRRKAVESSMTSTDFIQALRAQVIDFRHHQFSDGMANRGLDKVRDPQARAAIEWFRTLAPEHRKILLNYVRQSAVDTVASMLAIFDGVSYLPPFNKGFALSTGDGTKLGGDLSDLFLEAEELAERGQPLA